ncbi:hypothetical protein H1Q63_16520 [Desmonostoc muscorum CCALA 125]|nr:hypothetical protein [Desmonostoc muscorum CCALA 125]
MPRQTYGPEPKKRVKRLLEALLCFADGEFEDCGLKIKYDWKDEDSTNPKLTIQTTLVALEWLTQKDKSAGKLTKAQIREALNLLKDFLNILEDNRVQTKGVDDWHFTLKLWSRDKEKNLKRFDEAWENSRPKKSKELAANFTQDEGVATVPQTKLTQCQPPPLPAHFVERPEYSNDLKTRLLNGSSSESRTLVITAIHGLGSVGKSTLAAALAHDAEVQTRFCDGILWATLGQQPDVLALLSGWVQALGDYSFKPTSVTATSNHLRTLLYDKAVLLVVDDAWNTENAQAFNVGGARCQVLVTTREGHIADALAASTYSLNIMKPDQAMELLTKKLRREITGTERHSAENLAKGVGYLPLALELAAAEVAYGTTWDELLGDIQQEVARLTSFDRPEAEEITDEASLKRLSLTASLNLSVKRMPAEKQQHFSWLGVLPEDVNINKMMAATLWQMDKRDAAKMLQYLRNKALLLTGVPLADGMPTYRLHDLFHDLACNLLTASSVPKRPGDLVGLGLNLADVHAALLEKYRQKTQNGLWHTLPNDGYIHQHLVWHLEKAGQLEEIHQLLREESATGSNGWYEVREQLAQTGGYITDISRAWELAEANWTESTLSLQCRYALITASMNSLAANLPANLLVALVKNKMWTPEQGLAYALQKPEPEHKVKALVELVNYLPPNLEKLALSKALAASSAIQYDYYRACALFDLTDKLPELLPEALVVARTIHDKLNRARALSFIADKHKLPEVLLEALAVVQTIQDRYDREFAFSALVGNLPELLPETLALVRAIQDKSNRVFALSALANKLPELLPEALATARTIQGESDRALAFSDLAGNWPELLPEALAVVEMIQDEYDRACALCALVDKLTPDLLLEALAASRAIQNDQDRVSALSAIADKMPELLSEVLTTAKSIQDESDRAIALSALANKLPELLPEALAAAKSIQDESDRAIALSALANKLPELLPEALAAAQLIQYESDRVDALSILVNKLPPQLLPEALAAAKSIQNDKYRVSALSVLADKVPEILPEALAAAIKIQDQLNCASALRTLANKLPLQLLPEALAAARKIQDERYRADALRALIDKLPTQLFSEMLVAARTIQDDESRAFVLIALANKLPEVLPEALASARKIEDEYYRTDALITIANKLSEVLPEALASAREIEDEYCRADTLITIANKLPEVLPEALASARKIEDEYYRADTLITIANKLPEVLPEALAAVREIENNEYRAETLSALANKLPDVLPEALAAAKAIQFKKYRAKALRALASSLSQMPAAELFPLWEDTLHELSLRTRHDLLQDIEALFPVIFALGGEAATAEIARAIVDVGRWWK